MSLLLLTIPEGLPMAPLTLTAARTSLQAVNSTSLLISDLPIRFGQHQTFAGLRAAGMISVCKKASFD